MGVRDNVVWIDIFTGKEVTKPKNDYIGFVYLIVFNDGTQYIGKKNFYSMTTKESSRNKDKTNVISNVYHNRKGRRISYDVIRKESNWKTYKGSAKECKNKIVDKKFILEYASTKLQLTYLETKYQFIYEVLENTTFLNENILGKFYRGMLYDSEGTNKYTT